FMATQNDGVYKDFYALATGAGIGYETAPIKGFQIGMSGFFIYRLASNITEPCEESGKSSRYEVGLFDVMDIENGSDLDRLEDLYIRYSYKKSTITLGKQHIKTPFINPQDSRMRPTLVEGLELEWSEFNNLKLSGGWINRVSPRGTVKWFGIGETIGVYPVGSDVFGEPSAYKNHLTSAGIGYLGLIYKKRNLSFQAWDFYIENILNTAYLQGDWQPAINKGRQNLVLAGQLIRQDAINHGGNLAQNLSYTPKGSNSWVLGARIGIKGDLQQINFNYTRITAHGRFLMPREWGREPLFTYMQRERNEGFGDVNAFSINFSRRLKNNLLLNTGYGHFLLPDVKNTGLNKYGIPSYSQFNGSLRYEFQKKLQGLEMELIYVRKNSTGNTYGNPDYVINKVDLSHYSLILDYHF
ncbi:MAG: outer membrane porin, OprD family, partial [Bacteroidetes bacterium]|nr:outer membrane porin, OprD family [Bacteroidota bacterium]